MTDRLNARIDRELARKVKYLQERTRQTTTEIVKESIEAYYERMRQQEAPTESLAAFIGSGSGPRELSTSYKSLLGASLQRKTRT